MVRLVTEAISTPTNPLQKMLVEEGSGEFRMEGEREVIFSLRLLFAGDYLAVVFCKYFHILNHFRYPRSADEYRVQRAERGLDVRFERFALPAIRIPLHLDIHESERFLPRHFVADGTRKHDGSRAGPENIRYLFNIFKYPFPPAEFVEGRALTTRNYQPADSGEVLFCPFGNDLNILFNFFGGGTDGLEMFLHIPLIREHSYEGSQRHVIFRARRGGSPASRSPAPPSHRRALHSPPRPFLRH